jgi:hypothetical protein
LDLISGKVCLFFKHQTKAKKIRATAAQCLKITRGRLLFDGKLIKKYYAWETLFRVKRDILHSKNKWRVFDTVSYFNRC